MSSLSWPLLGHVTGGSSGEPHLDFKPVDTSKTEDALRAAETACQLAIQQIPREAEVSQELLRYPEGEGDAIPITENDMEELQPGKFLGNTIVDFYIRFLERSLPAEHGKRFYFFNSFFFRKLLQSSAPTRIDPCKVDYEQLRRWTEKVNLFEKDYIFIPILESSHWSLIVICHLNSLTCAPDEMMRFPCMVHLDPLQGHHGSFEGLIRSYVLQAWMERFKPAIDKDQLLALYQMKYVQAKVPQQVNFHDCGLYVLNYIEVFLVKSTSPNFDFASNEMGVHFTSAHFVAEVLGKRRHIQMLILELIQISQDHNRKLIAMKNLVHKLLEASQHLRFFLNLEGYSKVCIKDVQLIDPSFSNGEDCEITHLSNHKDSMNVQHQQSTLKSKGNNEPSFSNSEDCEITHLSNHKDSMNVQHQQSTLKSRGNNEPLSGPQIELGLVEYVNRSESLSPKQQHVEFEIQTVLPTNFKGSIFEAKLASTNGDSISVQHQQPNKISRLDYKQLDGFQLQNPPNQSFLDKLEKIHCIELSEGVNRKYKRGKNMTEEETSVLLSCKMEGGRFCKDSGGATHWNFISKEIEKKLGSRPSADQCRLRYDTLLKAYNTYKKHCNKTGKIFSTITEQERLDLKVATTLCEEWYITIGKICDKAKSRKRIKINPSVCNDLHALTSYNSSAPHPPPISNGKSFEDAIVMLDSVCGTSNVALCNFFPTRILNSLNEDLLSTLLNLVQECSMMYRLPEQQNGKYFNLQRVCRRLAILEDCEWSEILNNMLKLWELKLLSVEDMDFEEGKDLICIHLWKDECWFLNLLVYKEILHEVLDKNPHLKTYYTSFPNEESSFQYIKVLSLYGCSELKRLDLKEFPNLKFLAISDCPQFNLVTGWEVATSLKSIDISWCNAYHDFSNLRHLVSLREFVIEGREWNKSAIPWQFLQCSQCVKLQRLEIWKDKSLSEIVDFTSLKDLKFLEHLALGACTFSNIQGLSGLQALKTLHLQCCKNLRRVPDLGCLKGLIELHMTDSGVEDVEGVGELHLLTLLNLSGCTSLKWLPFLGRLKALVYLDLSWTSVKEIPGREDLISLKTLH